MHFYAAPLFSFIHLKTANAKMNTKSFTVTIDGIPEEAFNRFWDHCNRRTKHTIGIATPLTDHVRLSFTDIIDSQLPDNFSLIVGSVLSAYGLQLQKHSRLNN